MTTPSTDHRTAPDAAGPDGLRLRDVCLTLGDGDTLDLFSMVGGG